MKTNHARKVSEQAFNELIEAVEAGKSQKLVEYLKAMGRFHNYSLGNAILIGFQKPDATHVAGFRTWQKLGRHVKRNEKGIAIMAPIVWRKKVTNTADKRNVQEYNDESAMAFKTAYVFDISQTDGKPLPEFALVNGDPGVYTERLKEFVTSKGIVLEYSESIGSAKGVSAGGLIKLKKGLRRLMKLCTRTGTTCRRTRRSGKPKLRPLLLLFVTVLVWIQIVPAVITFSCTMVTKKLSWSRWGEYREQLQRFWMRSWIRNLSVKRRTESLVWLLQLKLIRQCYRKMVSRN